MLILETKTKMKLFNGLAGIVGVQLAAPLPDLIQPLIQIVIAAFTIYSILKQKKQ